MAICQDCKKEMKTANACSQRFRFVIVDGQRYERDTTYYDFNDRCHDCGIVNKKGNLHHLGCDIERCPKCGGQLIGCDCKKDI